MQWNGRKGHLKNTSHLIGTNWFTRDYSNFFENFSGTMMFIELRNFEHVRLIGCFIMGISFFKRKRKKKGMKIV